MERRTASGSGQVVKYTPRVFIGSSTEGKAIAYALERELKDDLECVVWADDVFSPSRTTIEDLERVARSEVDCAVMVFTPDDIRQREGRPGESGLARKTLRDNIVFELGLFMGALGRGRTFGLQCSHCALDLPTDLLGITWLEFAHPHSHGYDSTDGAEQLDRLTQSLRGTSTKILSLLEAVGTEPVRVVGSTELIRSFPMRGLVTRPNWNDMIRGSTQHLWLYGMAEFGYSEDDEVPEILSDATRSACEIRVLLLNPDSAIATAVDQEEGMPAGTLASRIRASSARFLALKSSHAIDMEVRMFDNSPAVSIVRGDDGMYVTPYVRFLTGNNSPTFELRKTQPKGIFSRYERHFNKMWSAAAEVK